MSASTLERSFARTGMGVFLLLALAALPTASKAQSIKEVTLEQLKAGLEWTFGQVPGGEVLTVTIIDAKFPDPEIVDLTEPANPAVVSDRVIFMNVGNHATIIFGSDNEQGVLPLEVSPPPPNIKIRRLQESGQLTQIDPPLPIVPDNPNSDQNALRRFVASDMPPEGGQETDALKLEAISVPPGQTLPGLGPVGLMLLSLVLLSIAFFYLRRRAAGARAA